MSDPTLRPYLTDLTDAEFARLHPLLPPPKTVGRPRLHPLREILNAIFYVMRSGCAWRLLPHEFPAADGLSLFPPLAPGRHVGAPERCAEILTIADLLGAELEGGVLL